MPISLQSHAKQSESSGLCSCDRGAAAAKPKDSLSHQPTPSFQAIESPVFMDIIVEIDSETMAENMESLLQQLACLTNTLNGSTATKEISRHST